MNDGPAKRSGRVRLALGLVLTATVAGGVWLWQSLRETELETQHDQPAATVPTFVIKTAQPPQPEAGEHPLVRLARRSPAEAWRAAVALQPSRFRKSLLIFIAALWVERDPKGAMDTFEGMDEEHMPAEWMFELLARWMAADEQVATDWALVTAGDRPRLLVGGAIDWILENAEPREGALGSAERILRRWAVRTPTEAWDFAATDGLAEQDRLLKAVAHVWFEADPRAALDAAVSHGRWQVLRESWVADLAAGWARAAPYAAADWLRTLTASTRHRALLAAVHAPLSVAAPHEAFAIAQELGAGEMAPAYSATMYRRQLRRLLGDDPRVLAHWLARQPDDDLRFGLTGSIAEIYEESYPDEALRWALALPGKESREALGVVIWAIAEDDLDYAEAIVLHMADPDAQAGAAAALLGHWASKRGEPAAAHEWSSKNLSAAARGEAARGLFSVWGLRDPSAAASAVAAIGDADERRAALAGALWGTVMGVGGDETAERLRERMLAMERLYQRRLLDVPDGGDGAGGEQGDLTSYKLYHYWKDVDPDRAKKYRRKAERYEGPTQ